MGSAFAFQVEDHECDLQIGRYGREYTMTLLSSRTLTPVQKETFSGRRLQKDQCPREPFSRESAGMGILTVDGDVRPQPDTVRSHADSYFQLPRSQSSAKHSLVATSRTRNMLLSSNPVVTSAELKLSFRAMFPVLCESMNHCESHPGEVTQWKVVA